ncbi:MAG: putative addiction module antidote protein [Gammaproteobacteria bacterium]|nr:putative addiction module antidote protein [Gammaproteobacteria bacterium]
MKKVTLSSFDAADYLDSEEAIAEYLNAILEEDDPALFLTALGDVAKARGMSQIAVQTGLGRESLYKTFAPGAHPRYETVIKVLKALGVKLTIAA